jgi:hypothetical protein
MRLAAAVAMPVTWNGHTMLPSLSIGVAIAPEDGTSCESAPGSRHLKYLQYRSEDN